MDIWVMSVIGGGVSLAIPPTMELLKKKFPTWNKKAWFPLVFGAVASTGAAMAAGQITDWKLAVTSVMIGLSAGGISSSVRDVVVGK